MPIQHVHAYRFNYLKSEAWQSVRLSAIARDRGICRMCGVEVGLHGDAHHIIYPKSFWQTKVNHLVTLCRSCHDFVHKHERKNAKSRAHGRRAFSKLKRKFEEQKSSALFVPTRCWFCRTPSKDIKPFQSKHPKLFEFHVHVCDPCWCKISTLTEGSDNPFKIIRSTRAKKTVDTSS